MTATDVLQHLWFATLALSLALAVVAILRRPWLRAFGAEQACHLWWLPPLAVLASQLPRPALLPPVMVQAPVLHWLSDSSVPASRLAAAAAPAWPAWLLLAWLLGAGACLLLAAWQQRSFAARIRGAHPSPHESLPQVWVADDCAIGPALVGVWRPRIVVPADFAQRHDASERRLILAHEMAHARRRDTLASLVATIVRALFWFHPAAWWAEQRMRRDQDLACDAVVLRSRPGLRRCYAGAMLKVQCPALAAPLACPWLSHPLKERIVMLKASLPTAGRRRVGLGAMLLLTIICSGSVYAARSAAAPSMPANGATIYQLSLVLTRGDATVSSPTLCVHAAEAARLVVSPRVRVIVDGGVPRPSATTALAVQFKMTPLARQRVEVALDGHADDGTGHQIRFQPVLRGPLGQTMSTRLDTPQGAPLMTLTVLPRAGCKAVSTPL
ncbi:MAG TPA: M56 family metallopeptidase [Rhodanobacteraceae bacterium]|nr:M56 family metallopeptidase [Rhodanobacteraceae bacterium]